MAVYGGPGVHRIGCLRVVIEELQGENFMRRFSSTELKRLRNDIPVRLVIETLLQLPHKEVEGVYRFLCPVCEEFATGLNPRVNLARCFRCKKNFNPIELLMADRGLSFSQSVNLLLQKEHWLSQAHQQKPLVSKEDCSLHPETPSLSSFLLSIACAGD